MARGAHGGDAGTANWFGGSTELSLQGRDIHGDVVINQDRRPPAWVRCQVPPGPAHFTDHERVLGEVDAFLGSPDARDHLRVVVVRGAPGSGTTALACHWVHQHTDLYPDGQLFVPLTGGPDEADREREALEVLLRAARLPADEIPASLEGRSAQWRSWSAGRRLILVIDGALTVAQVRALLPGPGPAAVLVTEAGPLTSLRAWADVRYVDLTPMPHDAARELLDRLAGRERLAAEPDAVDTLLRVCEGSTVALCVVGTLLADDAERPVALLAHRLADERRTLSELAVDESLSVRVVLDAAYHRLRPLAQRCYRALGVHPGSGSVGADAVAVALGLPTEDACLALEQLARARLAQRVYEGRYRISGLVRRHAGALADGPAAAIDPLGAAVDPPGPAADSVEGDRLRRSFVAYYWARALAAERMVMPHRGWRELLWPELDPRATGTADDATAWLDAERDNLRAAVDMAVELGDHRRVAQLCVALWPLHLRGGHAHDMVATNRLGVAAADAEGDAVAAAVLETQLGFGHRELGDLTRAGERFAHALARAEEAGSAEAMATALEALGLVRVDQRRTAEAADLLRRSLVMATQMGRPRRLAVAQLHLAKVESPVGALALLDQARAAFAVLGDDEHNLTKVDLWRGRKLTEAGRLAEAGSALTQAAAIADERGWHLERAQVAEAWADLALARGDAHEARLHLETALQIYEHRSFTARAEPVVERLRLLAASG